jgi:hypothetical protein
MMNFKKNILGVAVLSSTVLLAGQAVADASLDAPETVVDIPATAVTVADVTSHSVAGIVSYTAANIAVNNLISGAQTAADDVKNLAALNKSISDAEGLISQAQALSAGQLIGGKSKAEVIAEQRSLLGVDATTGVHTRGTSGLITDRDAKALKVTESTKAAAAAQATLNTLATGGISNSLILGLQAAAGEDAESLRNGTLSTTSADDTLGKIAADAADAIGTERTNAVTADSDATGLRKKADDAAKVLTDAVSQLTAANADSVNASAGSYVPNEIKGSDATVTYVLTAENTADGKVVDVRDQTKQIVWTFGDQDNVAANTGTLAELAAAITANDMDYTAEVDDNDDDTLVLTATNTRLGAVVGDSLVGVGTDVAEAAADAIANGPTISSTKADAVLYKAKNLTTYEVNVAELRLASTNAANKLSAAIADASNKNDLFDAGKELEASYAATEKAQLTEAGAAMATISGVLNEDLARANAATAVKEKEAQGLEAITSKNKSDLEAAQAKLTDAKAAVATAETAKENARIAFVDGISPETKTAYEDAKKDYDTAVANEKSAQVDVDAANTILYGIGRTAASALDEQSGTNKDSVDARSAVVAAQKIATGKEQFLNMQVQLTETGNPAGALQTGLMASNNDSGALVVTAVNTNYQATKTNATGIAANVATLEKHEGLVTTNIANIATNTTNIATNTGNIATNTTNIATNATNIATNTGNIATNTTNIATNTGNIATNKSGIATNTSNIASNTSSIADLSSSFADNTANLQRVEMQLNADVDMLKSGIASTLAIAGMPTVSGEGMGFSVGTGYYDGESAIAMGLTYVEGNRSYKLSFGNSGGETSASAGAAFKF